MIIKEVTYGVYGFMDWVVRIPAGRAHVCVHFTGGVDSGYGVVPAEYVTQEPFVQHLIEGCEFYRSGRIVKLGERVVAAVEKVRQDGGQQGDRGQTAAHSEDARMGGTGDGTPTTTGAEAAGTVAEIAGADSSTDSDGAMHFACLQDAQAWLMENYGIASRNTRTRPTAIKMAADRGVKIVID